MTARDGTVIRCWAWEMRHRGERYLAGVFNFREGLRSPTFGGTAVFRTRCDAENAAHASTVKGRPVRVDLSVKRIARKAQP